MIWWVFKARCYGHFATCMPWEWIWEDHLTTLSGSLECLINWTFLLNLLYGDNIYLLLSCMVIDSGQELSVTGSIYTQACMPWSSCSRPWWPWIPLTDIYYIINCNSVVMLHYGKCWFTICIDQAMIFLEYISDINDAHVPIHADKGTAALLWPYIATVKQR